MYGGLPVCTEAFRCVRWPSGVYGGLSVCTEAVYLYNSRSEGRGSILVVESERASRLKGDKMDGRAVGRSDGRPLH